MGKKGQSDKAFNFESVKSDPSLNRIHIDFLKFCYTRWEAIDFQNPVMTSSAEMMNALSIESRFMYMEMLNVVIDAGYIQYFPGYHAINGCSIYLLVKVKKKVKS